MQEELGTESDLIPGIASGFGGGLGRRGLVCGALNGGVMAIGLRYGRMREMEDKDTAYALVLELCRRFEGQHGSALCRDLTGCDFTTPEDRQKWSDSNGHEKCSQYVTTAVEILLDLLGE
jgi:C_GCAxxG_C_C family probable redox protein